MSGLAIIGIILILWGAFQGLKNEKLVTVIDLSHDEILNSLKTENDIIRQFGIPDSQKTLNGFTEWIYFRGKRIRSNTSGQSASGYTAVGAAYTGISKLPIGAGGVRNENFEESSTETHEDTQYIKFVFYDKKVQRYESNGVDLTTYTTMTKAEAKKQNKTIVG